jgi:hypothetical protein
MTLPATTTPKLTACYIRVTQQDSERYSPDAQRAEFLEIANRATSPVSTARTSERRCAR